MAAEGVIVRRLNAIENFGIMDLLCTDKTGTLTQGTIQLSSSYDSQGEDSVEIAKLAYLNAYFQEGIANPLDEAILVANKAPELSRQNYEKLDEVPYDFERRRLSILVKDGKESLLICKGALDKVREICQTIEVNGAVEDLDSVQKETIERKFED